MLGTNDVKWLAHIIKMVVDVLVPSCNHLADKTISTVSYGSYFTAYIEGILPKWALSAMHKHGGWGLFGRTPSTYEVDANRQIMLIHVSEVSNPLVSLLWWMPFFTVVCTTHVLYIHTPQGCCVYTSLISLRSSDAYMCQWTRPSLVKTCLLPIWCQAIIWTNTDIYSFGPLVTNFNEIAIKIQTFSLKKKCTSKCRRQTDSHFVLASMC